MKKLYIICFLFLFAGIQNSVAQCTTNQPSAVLPIYQDSARITIIQGVTGATYILEYGQPGFTPGTDANPGTGGTIYYIASYSNSVYINGLQPYTTYEVYARRLCTGVWGPNSTPMTMTTAPDCSTFPSISCETMITANHPKGRGAWQSNDCYYNMNGSVSYGAERIYSFTPTVSGMHSIFVPVNTNFYSVSFSYKLATGSCDVNGWSCIGSSYGVGNIYSNTNQYTFGPLNAGVTYWIMVDPQEYNVSSYTVFRIECPYCPAPGVSISNISTASAQINHSGGSSSTVIEYGLKGFTPGTGNTAGPNGTIITGSSGTYLTGLTPETDYDVYVRRSCGGGLYSPNSDRQSFYTLPCPFTLDYWQVQQSGTVGLNWYYSGIPNFYQHVGNCFNYYQTTNMNGGEYNIRFLAPSSGNFELKVVTTTGFDLFNFEVALGQNCDVGNAQCLNLESYNSVLGPFPNQFTYTLSGLIANEYYDIFVDVDSTFLDYNQGMNVTIKCPEPTGLSINNIQPTSFDVNWYCGNCQSSPFIEYGPAGFIPGTGGTAGTNGTLITNAGPSPYTLTGLSPTTKYDVYIRNACGNTMFSPNSAKKTVRTAVDCSTAPVVGCSDLIQYSVSSNSNAITGSWETYACQGTTNQTWATEQIWKFTPSTTGNYELYNYNFSPASTGYVYSSHVYLKEEGLGCNELNWNCIATLSFSYSSFTPQYIPLGLLDGGTTYYIMVDGVQPTYTPGYSYKFQILCPGVCAAPSLTTATTTINSATVNGVCPTCTGNMYVEYGPPGFSPGVDENPGGGIVLSNVSFPVVIPGLNSGDTYDVYARQDCAAPIGFSNNSNKLTIAPCYTAPAGITSTLPSGSTVCEGTSITLTQTGGQVPPGGDFLWYAGTCGSTVIGTGNSITVNPVQNTTYRVKAAASCGESNCTSYFVINVTGPPSADIILSGPASFCDGGSVVLITTHGVGLTYAWFNNGILIPNALTDTLEVISSGTYTVTVTNPSGCSKTSDPQVIIVNPNPVTSFSGLQPTYNSTSSPATLIGTPSGGTFSGPGVSGNTFDPGSAGIGGPYTITYNYTDANGCSGSNSQQTTVNGCLPPVLLSVATTNSQAIIDGSCPGCTNLYLEYGPAGFTPGTNANAGTGGIVINVTSFPVTISSLTPEVAIDVYARNDCGGVNGFSTNSNKLSFTPCFVAPITISSNVPGNTICIGTGVLLTQSGGTLPPSGVYKWYSGACGSVFLGSGNSINVAPAATTTYWVRIESNCGISSCSQPITINVNANPPSTITPLGATTFCSGGNVVLSAAIGTGFTYQWMKNGSNILNATVVNYTATSSGQYSVIITNTAGCSVTSGSISVTANPLPTVSFSGLLASYTDTSPSSTLTGSPAGGTFSGPGVTGNNFNPIAAGAGGPYTITYSFTDGNGCTNSSSQQTSVTGCTVVPAQPGTITMSGGISAVCPSESRTYTINPIAGANYYTWTPPAGAIITNGQSTISVTLLFTNTFTSAGNVSVVAVNNCGSSTARTLNIPRNTPSTPGVITGATYGVCNQIGVPYSVTAVAGFTYNWSFINANGFVAGGQGTNSITANFGSLFTNETVSVTASNTCGASSPRTLALNAAPATPPSITGQQAVCSGQQGVPYSITPLFGVVDYKWSAPKKSHVSDGVVTSTNWNLTTTSANVFVDYGNKTGSVDVYGSNGCGSGGTKSININFNCREGFIDIPEAELEVNIFPNPAQNEINININNNDEFEVEIQNMIGEKVFHEINNHKLNITNLPSGLYLVKVIVDGETITKKINIDK